MAILAALALAASSAAFAAEATDEAASLAKVGDPAPDFGFAALDGSEHRLSEFRGRPAMVWLIATWCPTCEASARVLAERADELRTTGLAVITLKLYNNLGYEGPTIGEFAAKWAPSLLDRPGWFWGEADLRTSLLYDPRGYPDIYWLVDAEGVLQRVDTAPNVTFDEILGFAAGS